MGNDIGLIDNIITYYYIVINNNINMYFFVKKTNKYVIKYSSDERIISREYEIV